MGSKLLEETAGGLSFGPLPGRAFGLGKGVPNCHLHGEPWRMSRSSLFQLGINRRGQPQAGGCFLEMGLGIGPDLALRPGFTDGAQEPGLHQGPHLRCAFVSGRQGIEVDRCQQRLHGIGQGLGSHGWCLPRVDGLERTIQPKLQRPRMQGVGAHEHASQFAHGALLPVGALPVQQKSHQEIQEGVPQEFKTLVVAQGSGRCVGEGLPQKGRIPEPVAQPGLQAFQVVFGFHHDQYARSAGSCWLSLA